MLPGPTELLIILAMVLLIFGAGKLPAIGDALGRSIKNFRRASAGKDELEVGKKKKEELESGSDSGEVSVRKVEEAEVVEGKTGKG